MERRYLHKGNKQLQKFQFFKIAVVGLLLLFSCKKQDNKCFEYSRLVEEAVNGNKIEKKQIYNVFVCNNTKKVTIMPSSYIMLLSQRKVLGWEKQKDYYIFYLQGYNCDDANEFLSRQCNNDIPLHILNKYSSKGFNEQDSYRQDVFKYEFSDEKWKLVSDTIIFSD